MTDQAARQWDLASILEGLLQRVVSGAEDQAQSYLCASRSFYQRDGYDEIEETIQEFGRDLDRLVAPLVAAWGPPAFGDNDLGGDDVGTAHNVAEELYWLGAVRLACWERRPGVFVYVMVQHADVELPVLLTAGSCRFAAC